MERLGQSDVATIGKRRDDQTSSVAKVLVGVAELSVTDVAIAVLLGFIPPSRGNGC